MAVDSAERTNRFRRSEGRGGRWRRGSLALAIASRSPSPGRYGNADDTLMERGKAEKRGRMSALEQLQAKKRAREQEARDVAERETKQQRTAEGGKRKRLKRKRNEAEVWREEASDRDRG